MRRLIYLFILFLTLSLSSMAQPAGSAASRPKIGLVLGGGGAKGAAEVGVLKVIEEVGLPIDYIAGTSIGSIVGGLYACGYRAKDLDRLFRSQEWLTLLTDRKKEFESELLKEEDGVTYILGFPVSRRKRNNPDARVGMLNGDQITALLDSMTHRPDSIDFTRLPIPFKCVAADFNRQEEVVISSGSLSKAMRASMAIPGAFKSVRWGDRILVDGGMMNNLPVDVVRAMGADIVIAIDLEQEKHKPRSFNLKETLGIGGLLDWAVSRPDWTKYNENVKDADLVINPKLIGYDVTSFGKKSVDEMIRLGEAEARKHIQELRRLKP